MKIKTIIRLVIIAVIAIIILLWINPFGKKQEAEIQVTHNMIVQRIEELGRLEVAKYSISDVITYTKRRDWLPNSSVALMVMGEVITCVDMTQIRSEDVTVHGDSVSIILPMPEVCTFKIDHSRSKVYDVKYGLWKTHELVDEAYKDAEKQIYKQALDMGMAKESQDNARKVITSTLSLFGFKSVHVSFQTSPYTEGQELKLNR